MVDYQWGLCGPLGVVIRSQNHIKFRMRFVVEVGPKGAGYVHMYIK